MGSLYSNHIEHGQLEIPLVAGHGQFILESYGAWAVFYEKIHDFSIIFQLQTQENALLAARFVRATCFG